MKKRSTSKQRLKAADELANFIACGGDATKFMSQFHPEDAVLINDMAFGKLHKRSAKTYPVSQADADCLPFLTQCSSEFVRARKEMGQNLLSAFDAWRKER